MIIVMTYLESNEPSFTGPFANHSRSALWGRQWQARNDDDPRWQVLEVSASFFDQMPVLNSPI
jgi:hypothetical protein